MRIFVALAFLVLVAGCESTSSTTTTTTTQTSRGGDMATGSRIAH